MIEELKIWAKNPQPPYGWSKELPTYDFNRELFAPGQNEDIPEGVVAIRTDEDFWLVAALPWKFKDVPLAQVIETLWPEVAARGYSTHPDTGPAALNGEKDE